MFLKFTSACLFLIAPVWLMVAGCKVIDPVVGVWTPDTSMTVLPEVPFPGFKEQVRTMSGTMILKLREDQTCSFVPGPVGSINGTWSRDKEGVIEITPDPAEKMPRLPVELKFTFDKEKQNLIWNFRSTLGEIKFAFRKSG